jgi:hypothetical protein
MERRHRKQRRLWCYEAQSQRSALDKIAIRVSIILIAITMAHAKLYQARWAPSSGKLSALQSRREGDRRATNCLRGLCAGITEYVVWTSCHDISQAYLAIKNELEDTNIEGF